MRLRNKLNHICILHYKTAQVGLSKRIQTWANDTTRVIIQNLHSTSNAVKASLVPRRREWHACANKASKYVTAHGLKRW